MFIFNVRTGTSALLMHCLMMCDAAVEETEELKKINAQLGFMVGPRASGEADKQIAKPSIHLASQYDEASSLPVVVPPAAIESTFVKVLSESGKKWG